MNVMTIMVISNKGAAVTILHLLLLGSMNGIMRSGLSLLTPNIIICSCLFVGTTKRASPTSTTNLKFNRLLSPSSHSSTNSLAHNSMQRTLDDGGYYISEQIIKKSRFIGIAKHCQSWEEAQAAIKLIREEHIKSRHVCFGVVTVSPQQERSSDDGEPTGTAGAPILGAIKGDGLTNTLCVVVRYFGGIKLGAGGLIRAYGGTARQVLREASIKDVTPKTSFRISSPSANYAGPIYDIVNRFNTGIVTEEVYQNSGDFQMTITCEANDLARMEQSLLDGTRGNIQFIARFY